MSMFPMQMALNGHFGMEDRGLVTVNWATIEPDHFREGGSWGRVAGSGPDFL